MNSEEFETNCLAIIETIPHTLADENEETHEKFVRIASVTVESRTETSQLQSSARILKHFVGLQLNKI